MANTFQKVIIMGRLGRDAEVRSAGNAKVAALNVATSESWKDKQGQWQDKTEWHTVSVWIEPLMNMIEERGKKGAMVLVEGKLETRKWVDKEGKDRLATEVVVRPFGGSIVFPKSSEGGGSSGRSGGYQKSEPSGARDEDLRDELDDDLPFS